jgi:F-type H+-transporting ATPase subunit gamma
MSQTSERAKTRLRNLKAIEPLLSALKTISMGNWQMALNKVSQIQHYEQHYRQILADILPVVKDKVILNKRPGKDNNRVVILIIGTEHGLCGRFNDLLVENTLQWLQEQDFLEKKVWALGTKMTTTLERKGVTPDWAQPLPGREVGSYEQAFRMTQDWQTRYENREFDRLVVLYNQAVRGGGNEFSTQILLPFQMQPHLQQTGVENKKWPAPIIETDPVGILRQINLHFLASSFYQVQLKSMIAESSSRFRIMEEAKQNAGDIMTALSQEIQAERKRQITQEMQELAVGAGLIDNK